MDLSNFFRPFSLLRFITFHNLIAKNNKCLIHLHKKNLIHSKIPHL